MTIGAPSEPNQNAEKDKNTQVVKQLSMFRKLLEKMKREKKAPKKETMTDRLNILEEEFTPNDTCSIHNVAGYVRGEISWKDFYSKCSIKK